MGVKYDPDEKYRTRAGRQIGSYTPHQSR